MKRVYAAIIGAVIMVACVAVGWQAMEKRNTVPDPAFPVCAYVDLEHVIMSHPRYSEYHRLELEYNAMVAQYQFEQWNYSQKAAAEHSATQQFAAVDAVGTAALNQELQAKLALKQNELNNALKQQYDRIAQETRKSQPVISNADNLKIVNLQLKLQNIALSEAERKAATEELHSLLRDAGTDVVRTGEEEKIAAAMKPYQEKAQKELEEYAKEVKAELEKRQGDNRSAFQNQLGVLKDRPDPAVWNKEWKDKLSQKEAEMKAVKDDMMADIRNQAASVAQEQGIDIVFSEYAGVGNGLDITDDIIAKLA